MDLGVSRGEAACFVQFDNNDNLECFTKTFRINKNAIKTDQLLAIIGQQKLTYIVNNSLNDTVLPSLANLIDKTFYPTSHPEQTEAPLAGDTSLFDVSESNFVSEF